MIFLLSLLMIADLPYPLVTYLDDQTETPDGLFLTRPMDAVIFEGKLYIADMSNMKVFVLDGKELTAFGQAGTGPGEFQHSPQYLEVRQEGLAVGEFNHLRTSYFTAAGTFLRMEKRGENTGRMAALGFRRLRREDSRKTGYILRDVANDCLMSKPEDVSDKGFHLSKLYFRQGDDGLLFLIKRSGKLEVYQRPCKRITSMPLPFELFKAKIKPNSVSTQFARLKNPGSKVVAYFHGVPIIGAAVRDKHTVWLLVKDENKEEPPYYQSVTGANNWLYEVDPIEKKVTFSMECPYPVSRIRYMDGHLILLSQYESSVAVYDVR